MNPPARSVSVSVIMRSKNSDWVVAQALAGLFSQSYTDFELTVVDSGSTDRTVGIVRQFPARIIQIPARDYFPGAVLNKAIEATTGETLVFQNSDAVPLSPGTLSRLLEPLRDGAVVATFARQVPRPEAHPWVRRDYTAAFPASGQAPSWMPFSLPLAVMRRSIWRDHPFQVDTWGSEDTEWGYWALRHGHQIRYVPEAVVMHSHNYTLRQLYGRRFIEGEADAFIHRAHLGWTTLVARIIRSTLGDCRHYVREGEGLRLGAIPARRVVHHWAYFRGHRHGEARLTSQDPDASVGQRIVLDRYER